MNMHHATLLAAGLIVAGNALAESGETLAANYNCTACHAISGKSTGPAFRDVAAKYRSSKDALSMLEKKVRKGGAGAWGSIPMPATARSVSDADIRIIINWILAMK